MAHDEALNEMKEYLAERLHDQKGFPVIDAYVKNKNLAGQQRQRLVYTKDCLQNEYLIYCHADPFPNNQALLDEQKKHRQNALSCFNVLYSGEVFFKWDAAVFSKIRVGTPEQRRRYMRTVELERLLNKRDGKVTYFKPDKRTLEHVKFNEGTVTSFYSDSVRENVTRGTGGHIPHTARSLVTIMDHEVLETLGDFYLTKRGFISEEEAYRGTSLQELLRQEMTLRAKGRDFSAYDERISIMLESAGIDERRRLTQEFGTGALGQFCVHS